MKSILTYLNNRWDERSSFFFLLSYNEDINKIAMGLPLGPVIAGIFMAEL